MVDQLYSARKHAAGPQSLRNKLVWLRGFSENRSADPRLHNWCVKHLSMASGQVDAWCERAWWGIAAGELTRVYLNDQHKRDEALALLGVADWSTVDTALGQSGVILATAHIGPPKFLMNVVIDRYAKAMVLTNMHDMPGWLATATETFLDPRNATNRPMIMLKSALHLRSGGLLFAAPDGGFSADHVNVKGLNQIRRFSVGIPMLARRLNVVSFSTWVLWEGDNLALRILPIQAPKQDLGDKGWTRAWIEDHWADMSKVIVSSPENLRFLAAQFRREFGT